MPQAEASSIYESLSFGPIPKDRPFACIDMVATIDGKILSGKRDETVADLGSKTDHELMKRIEHHVDAVLIGAGTLRATNPQWQPQAPIRVVVTGSGEITFESKIFEKRAIIACTNRTQVSVPDGVEIIRTGEDEVEIVALLNILRTRFGVERLLILGGSETNARFLAKDLVDELFLTVAPKVKLGRDLPTYAGGEPLDREAMLDFALIEHHVVGDEIFLRYRRKQHA